MWLSAARNEASRLMAMNTKPRLYPRLAFNLLVAVVIGVCFGARSGVAQQSTVGEWSPVLGPTWPEFSGPCASAANWEGNDLARRPGHIGQQPAATILESRGSKRQPPYTRCGLRPLLLRPLVPGRRKVIRCGWPQRTKWLWNGERKYL